MIDKSLYDLVEECKNARNEIHKERILREIRARIYGIFPRGDTDVKVKKKQFSKNKSIWYNK